MLKNLVGKLEYLFYLFTINNIGKVDIINSEYARKRLMGCLILFSFNIIFISNFLENLFLNIFIITIKNFILIISIFLFLAALFVNFYFTQNVVSEVIEKYNISFIDLKFKQYLIYFIRVNLIILICFIFFGLYTK
jgi:hypothetical protein